jgi:hypothetical protein
MSASVASYELGSLTVDFVGCNMFEPDEWKCHRREIDGFLQDVSKKRDCGSYCREGTDALLDVVEKSKGLVDLMATIQVYSSGLKHCVQATSIHEDNLLLAYSNLELSIGLLMDFQPDRQERYLGLFETTVRMEEEYVDCRYVGRALSISWPGSFDEKYAIVEKYRIWEDPLYGLCSSKIPVLDGLSRSLFLGFHKYYVLPLCGDEGYENSVREFCTATAELASLCYGLLEAVSPIVGLGILPTAIRPESAIPSRIAAEERVRMIILYLRAICSFGLSSGYTESLERVFSQGQN